MTTGYSAGIESNSVILSYVPETAYGTTPAVAAKQLRYMSESLGSTKTRQRAAEIDASRQAADQVTTQFSAGGSINGAMSIGTYDELFASAFCASWATDALTNGTVLGSVTLQKQLATALWLRYPGAFCTGFSLSAAQGGFVSCSFNVLAQNETNATADVGTGAQVAAPTNKIINTVNMVSGITLGGVGLTKVMSLNLDVSNEGAAQQYAMGSTAAAGMLPGTFTANGRASIYFSDFTLYTRYVNETEGAFAFSLVDGTKSYLFELLNSVVMNPRIVSGGPGQSVMCEIDIEGRKDSVTGKTLRLTRDLT
jgi:hypothetical protein